jgi:hypothetical protein
VIPDLKIFESLSNHLDIAVEIVALSDRLIAPRGEPFDLDEIVRSSQGDVKGLHPWA